MSTFLGIDIGTGSARAGLFDLNGTLLGAVSHPIKMWNPQPDFYEQSSEDIWQAVSHCVKEVLQKTKVNAELVKGIGFDATCSLVALDEHDHPISVSPTGNKEQNIIVWMDHRAIEQADRINRTQHKVLNYVGGAISPEMETPKLLWIKENLPDTWKNASKFLDLADFLTYKVTGVDIRSLCTIVCKWTFQAHNKKETSDDSSLYGWDDTYFKQIGLGDLVEAKYSKIGARSGPMGDPVGGAGLTEEAAKSLNLKPGTPVGIGIIDAHAGGLGTLGAVLDKEKTTFDTLEERIALIAGTSACHMAVAKKDVFVKGVWGPYFSAMIPGMWLTEGGQSSVGSLIDHVIYSHKDSIKLLEEASLKGQSQFQVLHNVLDDLAKQRNIHSAYLTRDIHVLPYFHGNRSPRADPTLKGSIFGLTLASGKPFQDLALLYLATIQAIAHGTKHIIDEINKARGDSCSKITTIFLSGGFTKNSYFIRETADITGCSIVLPKEDDAVLLGSAILGAVASKQFPDILSAMSSMNKAGKIIKPDATVSQYHQAKHIVFQKLYDHQMEYRKIMGSFYEKQSH
eukprot:TRINITY_DN4688_c0_g1_i1.p1 TRINITY_DN4688_c0_g1~~TRINITY_DN4688_c0_g1_i1.p1  ORF type:complete len:569 (-),score=102.18 TRINITY_DN4688_c0_g1_i1:37-1743(-)